VKAPTKKSNYEVAEEEVVTAEEEEKFEELDEDEEPVVQDKAHNKAHYIIQEMKGTIDLILNKLNEHDFDESS